MANLRKFVDFLRDGDVSMMHPNAAFLFDWPGVFRTNPQLIPNDNSGAYNVIVNTVALPSVGRKQFDFYIDGYNFKVNGPPNFNNKLTLNLYEGIYNGGKLDSNGKSLYASLLNLMSNVGGVGTVFSDNSEVITDYQDLDASKNNIINYNSGNYGGGEKIIYKSKNQSAKLYILNNLHQTEGGVSSDPTDLSELLADGETKNPLYNVDNKFNEIIKNSTYIEFIHPVITELGSLEYDSNSSELSKFTLEITYMYAKGNQRRTQ